MTENISAKTINYQLKVLLYFREIDCRHIMTMITKYSFKNNYLNVHNYIECSTPFRLVKNNNHDIIR